MFPDIARYVVIAVMLLAFCPVQLLAGEFKLIPGLALKEEFNDNISLTSSRHSDFVTTLTPSLDISSTTERRALSLSTGINWLNYSRNSGLEAVDYFVRSRFDFRYDPRLALSAGASYVQDSNPYNNDLTGVTFKSGNDWQNYQLAANYAVSEISTSSVSYGYSKQTYEDSAYLPYWMHSATFGQDYDLDRFLRQTKLVGQFGYSQILTDTSRVDNYTVTLGLTKKIHEKWFIVLNAGGRYTQSELDAFIPTSLPLILPATSRTNNQGWTGNLSINYSGEHATGSLAFVHDVVPLSGKSGTTERTGVTTRLSDKITSELSGFCELGYFRFKSDQNQLLTQSDETHQFFSGGLRYEFSKYVALEGSYGYTDIDYGVDGRTPYQNIFRLKLTMQRDLLTL